MADVSESVFELLHKDVKATVESGTPGLRSKIVGRLADERLKEREQLLFDGIRKYDELRKEANKASRPDVVSFSFVNGQKVRNENFSEPAMKKKEAAEKALADFKNAYLWAIDGRLQDPKGKWVDDPSKLPADQQATLKKVPDFEPLKKAMGKGPSSPSPNESVEPEVTE